MRRCRLATDPSAALRPVPSAGNVLDPATLSLVSKLRSHRNSLKHKLVSDDAKCACTSACGPDTEAGFSHVSSGGVPSDFAKALALIAALPLSDEEKVAALRRLLRRRL
jgi:hypothetical protein